MRNVTAVLIVAIFATGLASAQMKAPPQKPTGPLSVSTPTVPAAQSLESAQRIPRDEAIRLVKSGKAVYVDVRSRQSYATAHIPGAISIPRSEMLNRLREMPPGKMLITYCACKEAEHTSALAVLELNAHGIRNTAALLGGWNEWKAAGLPTSTGDRP